MSYDHVWFCPTLRPKDWKDLSTIGQEELQRIANRHKCSGDDVWNCRFKVELSAGENYCIDELYVFLTESDALRFFEGGPLRKGETSFLGEERLDRKKGRPIGFDCRRLLVDGKCVAWDGPRHWDRNYWNSLPNRPRMI